MHSFMPFWAVNFPKGPMGRKVISGPHKFEPRLEMGQANLPPLSLAQFSAHYLFKQKKEKLVN